jgi:hypothetical protein
MRFVQMNRAGIFFNPMGNTVSRRGHGVPFFNWSTIMSMQITLSLFEALTEAGVKPESARKVERQVEAAIQNGHNELRSELKEQAFTKADGAQLRSEILQMETRLRTEMSKMESSLLTAMNTQLRWFITTVLGIAMAAIAVFKYL